jgi:hypothetical protein
VGRLIALFIPVLWEYGNRDFMLDVLWKCRSNEDKPFLIELVGRLLKCLFLADFTVDRVKDSVDKSDIYLGYFDRMFD